mmetsp:Transcript_18712/g.51384  ORF Transcript_18712/g.51384 Transcript_18712/m.51384 type:complete len:255 (-) Transcript_18712:260-1024(-)
MDGLTMGLLIAAVCCILLVVVVRLTGEPRWPFKKLSKRGTHKSAPLPSGGDTLEERKRDFARIAKPSDRPNLFVVTTSGGAPVPWSSEAVAIADGAITKDVADNVFSDFGMWLDKELAVHYAAAAPGLAERCVAMISATESFSFAMKHQIPPMFPQSKFVLVVTSTAAVRVAWVAFATDAPKPDLAHTPYILSLVTGDLNDTEIAATAEKQGIPMDYGVSYVKDKDLHDYVVKRKAAGFSRAAVDNDWNEILGK